MVNQKDILLSPRVFIAFFALGVSLILLLFYTIVRIKWGVFSTNYEALGHLFFITIYIYLSPLLAPQRGWLGSSAFVHLMNFLFLSALGVITSYTELPIVWIIWPLSIIALLKATPLIKSFLTQKYISFGLIISTIFFATLTINYIWGGNAKYFSPFYLEDVLIHDGGHRDTYFFSSLANILLNFNILSSGLDGLVPISYHAGGIWFVAQIASLIGMHVNEFYQSCFITLFLPFFYHSLLSLVLDFRKYMKLPSSWDFIYVSIVIIAIIFLGPIKKAVLGWQVIPFSPSWVIAIFMSYLLFSISIFYITSRKSLRLRDRALFLYFMAPIILGLIGTIKISVMLLLFPLIAYIFIRLNLLKKLEYIISAILISLSFYYSISLFTKYALSTEVRLCFLCAFPHYKNFLILILVYIWPILFCTTLIRRLKLSIDPWKNIISNKTLLLELAIILTGACFSIGGIIDIGGEVISVSKWGDFFYFSDYQRWALIPLTIGLINPDWILGKLRSYSKAYKIIIFLFLCISIKQCISLANLIKHYSSLSQSTRHELEGNIFIQEKYKLLNALIDLNSTLTKYDRKETILFIPKTNNLYWGDDKAHCDKYPFIATALSGVPQIQGQPDSSCYAICCGYHRYIYSVPKLLVENKKDLCLSALEKGFSKIIVLDVNDNKMSIETINCK